ncbi:LIM-domain-containing protein [Mycena indigotica]|uniref:LIM-domain-containing protein n=1 Tax=Mycena indigotica TaxID=2126181 RepID=A0A8H6W9H2_9AGAR|nr:LIM-domain-containing protein [Mycena indigotica]KAF7309707.1 LIM-domain-containing protein [Mycena indigotica]
MSEPSRKWSGDSDSSRPKSPRFPGSLPRSTPPTRAATVGPEPIPAYELPPHARSEDFSHGKGASRPSTPSKELTRRTSAGSINSAHSSSNSNPQPPSSVASTSLSSASCASCGKPMQGPFVRALGTVFHLNCFKCNDCGDVVASKFFPIEGGDGKQYPLCERDYFRRLNLICAKCGMALRGSYITACNKKFHVEHFTCSLCSTLFGPSDSYYEHDGDVYCHFHYSTRFATKCAGCSSAILKQFVEINRNMRDECWHPECYMINKFWNVKVVSRRPTSTAEIEGEHQEPEYVDEERRETPLSLKDRQIRMEQQVYRIWTVLSAFEESSAACISDMLRQVSNGQYLEAIRMAEKFILHVEVLFATIDDLEQHFYRLNMKGMSHVREARMLCRKTVELFTLLSHTQETGSRRMGMTQELLALVTGLAHYLKILIRIALTGALKLERERDVQEAMSNFLDKLHLLAVQGGNPSARRMIKGYNGESMAQSGGNVGTQGVTYGFRSLAPENAGESPFAPGVSSSSSKMPSDLCVKCNQTVEEDCVRLGTYQRWHSHCVQCAVCGKKAVIPMPKEKETIQNGEEGAQAPKPSTGRRPPANVSQFVYEVDTRKDTQFFGEIPTVILCTEHAHAGCRGGFQPVQRLEQYAFLLNVALRRLYFVLRKQGVVPLSPDTPTHPSIPESDLYRNSADIMRMKSVHLDRKLSATARLPKRSTIVESPAGRTAPSEVLASQKTQESTTASQPQQQLAPHAPQPQYPQQGQLPQQRSPSQPSSLAPRPHLGPLPPDMQGQVLRPSFARNNTEVMIVDDSVPNSPAGGDEPPPRQPPLDNGITLADIPQLMEVAQAREEQRSLPRENSIPYIAELSSLELAIVKHAALLVLTKSPLRDQFDLDELIEMVETKKSGFWNKLFKAGDKKNVKKKGVFGVPLEFLVEREGSDSLLGATRETLRVPSFIDDVISAMRQMDMSIEGIFRKNGNIRRLKELTETIDLQLAALLKKFLRDLPDPLMTFKLHRLICLPEMGCILLLPLVVLLRSHGQVLLVWRNRRLRMGSHSPTSYERCGRATTQLIQRTINFFVRGLAVSSCRLCSSVSRTSITHLVNFHILPLLTQALSEAKCIKVSESKNTVFYSNLQHSLSPPLLSTLQSALKQQPAPITVLVTTLIGFVVGATESILKNWPRSLLSSVHNVPVFLLLYKNSNPDVLTATFNTVLQALRQWTPESSSISNEDPFGSYNATANKCPATRMEAAAAEEKRRKQLGIKPEAKRPKLDTDASSTLASFDFTQLPAPLITELIVANLEAFSESAFKSLVDSYKESRGISSAPLPPPPPLAAAASRNGTPVDTKSPPEASPPIIKEEPVDPLKMDMDQDELEFEPDRLNRAFSDDPDVGDGNADAGAVLAENMQLVGFNLPPPKPLTEEERSALLVSSVMRIREESELAGESLPPDSTQAAGHSPTEMWMLLIVRMITRVVDPETPSVNATDEGAVSELYDEQDKLRQKLCDYIMADFPARLRLATAWMNEEWYNDRMHRDDMEWRPNYDTWLNQIIAAYQTLLDSKDRTFSRFLLDLPSVPEDVLVLLRELCVDANSPEKLQVGFVTLRGLVIQRPSMRAEALTVLLELTTHPDRKTRGAAINTVKIWVPNIQPMGDMVRNFALQMLRKLQLQTDVKTIKHNGTEANGDGEDENMEDGQLPPEDLVQTPYLPERIELPAEESQVLQHVELLFALCVKVPEFLDEIFSAYGHMDVTVQEAIQRLITALIRSLGATHGKLLTIMRNFPPGAESLALRVLNIFTENGRPGAQLVALIKGLISERELDARFLIPIIGEMDKADIIRHLPRIVSILGGDAESKNLVRSVFSSIVTTPPQTFSITSNLPRVRQSELLTPQELLALLHDAEKEIGLQSAKEAISVCFSMTDVFRSDVLAAVMQQIMDEPVLPVLFLRTVIQAVTTYKSLVAFVSTTLLSRLITKKIWTNPRLWEGFIMCAKVIAPASFGALLQLPKDQLRELVDKQPGLKAGLRDFVMKKAPNKTRVPGFLDIFGESEESPAPTPPPQPMQVVVE